MHLDSHLTLVNKLELVDPIVDYCYSWGLNHGLSIKRATQLALALNELVTDVVLFANRFEELQYEVFFYSEVASLEIVVNELGEPFDPKRHPYSVSEAINNCNFDGAGLELIKHLVDDFIFINKGPEGKEFRITKEILSPHISELPIVEEKKNSEEEKQYQLYPVIESDAEDLARLIYRTYGNGYPRVNLYYPDRIVKFIQKNEKYGVIVRNEENEAVSYFAVINKADSNIGEVAEAVVSPSHRKKGLMTMMMTHLIETARKKGQLGLYGEAVMYHPASQIVNAKFGYKSSAIILGAFPYFEAKAIDDNPNHQRRSVCIEYLPLKKPETKELFLPPQYKQIIKEIYSQWNITIKDKRIVKKSPAQKSEFSMEINYNFQLAFITVKYFGPNFIEVLAKKTGDLALKGIKTICLHLPLKQQCTKTTIPELQKMGFKFSGLFPCFHWEEDFLGIQKTFQSLNIEQIIAVSRMAKKIKKLISKEYESDC